MAEFKIMTWNVENLFLAEASDPPEDVAGYEQKLAFLSMVIESEAPDVVAFQEIGGDEELADLQMVLDGAYPHRAVSNFPDRRGIRVGMISRHPIVEQEDIVDYVGGPATTVNDFTAAGGTTPLSRMGRGALRIKVTVDGSDIHVITCHLKSKLLSYPRPWGTSFSPDNENQRAQVAGVALLKRTAEAVTLRTFINSFLENNANTRLILLGDFNDVPEAQTSLLLCGPPGSEIGTGGFDRPDTGDDARLFNLSNAIPEDRRFSRVHSGRREMLDQIYVSEELIPLEAGKRRLPDVDSLIDFRDFVPSVTEDPNERADDIAPDHAPVIATFRL